MTIKNIWSRYPPFITLPKSTLQPAPLLFITNNRILCLENTWNRNNLFHTHPQICTQLEACRIEFYVLFFQGLNYQVAWLSVSCLIIIADFRGLAFCCLKILYLFIVESEMIKIGLQQTLEVSWLSASQYEVQTEMTTDQTVSDKNDLWSDRPWLNYPLIRLSCARSSVCA